MGLCGPLCLRRCIYNNPSRRVNNGGGGGATVGAIPDKLSTSRLQLTLTLRLAFNKANLSGSNSIFLREQLVESQRKDAKLRLKLILSLSNHTMSEIHSQTEPFPFFFFNLLQPQNKRSGRLKLQAKQLTTAKTPCCFPDSRAIAAQQISDFLGIFIPDPTQSRP